MSSSGHSETRAVGDRISPRALSHCTDGIPNNVRSNTKGQLVALMLLYSSEMDKVQGPDWQSSPLRVVFGQVHQVTLSAPCYQAAIHRSFAQADIKLRAWIMVWRVRPRLWTAQVLVTTDDPASGSQQNSACKPAAGPFWPDLASSCMSATICGLQCAMSAK